ncbi:MAG TPA: GAF domain-containing protein, partial [Methylomirabilota bacterium]|nr:GAF domain-containing protein [Methylomirabilota bacterium]
MGRGSNRAKGNAKSAPRESQKHQDTPARELQKRLAEALDELETRNRELAESQEQQTATSEILRVISKSPTDTQPVFDTIVRRALALTGGLTATVLRLADGVMHLAAFSSTDETGDAALREFYPKPAIELPILASIVDRRTAIAIGDAQIDERVTPAGRQTARARGYRSLVFLPMLRDDTVIGVIGVTHREVAAFGAEHVRTLQTFADQAVIAIENVRLFTELQEKNRALTQAHSQLTESLEQQTGTVEILRVIASSPTDAQPVFDTIAANASRLCGGIAAIVARFDGEMMHLVAHHNPRPGIEPVTARLYPRRPGRDTTAGRAILERSIVHISDADKDPDLAPNLAADVRAGSFLAVPIMRHGRPIGAISVSRVETGAFPAAQVELLQTFADQAVIAIENVRLFTELEEKNRRLTVALDQQTATSEVLRAISSSVIDLQPV